MKKLAKFLMPLGIALVFCIALVGTSTATPIDLSPETAKSAITTPVIAGLVSGLTNPNTLGTTQDGVSFNDNNMVQKNLLLSVNSALFNADSVVVTNQEAGLTNSALTSVVTSAIIDEMNHNAATMAMESVSTQHTTKANPSIIGGSVPAEIAANTSLVDDFYAVGAVLQA